jgi:Domain of unknown function (DUF1844)
MAQENPKSGGPEGGKSPDQPSRIHIDSDWKREAQAEKERLNREVEAEMARPRPAPAAGAGHPASGGPAVAPGMRSAAGAPAQEAAYGPEAHGQGIPAASLGVLIEMLATQAAISMSDQHDPETGQPLQNLELAKHYIDLLGVLESKTQGNTTDDERRLLDTLLYELRMAYVSAAS